MNGKHGQENSMSDTELSRSARFCPQCAAVLEDRFAFGRQRRYCPVCERVVFRDHKIAAALLVVNATAEVLLVSRAQPPHQGLWALPAGFVDYDEDPAAAAVRECREETGLETEIEALLDVVAGREHAHGADIVLIYRGRIVGGTLLAADDAADAAFFPLDALPRLAFRATRRALGLEEELSK